MKSIFKKIAVVLALAMVVTLLPAKPATVSAADDLASKWVRSTCTLYLDAPTVPGDSYGIYVSQAYATASTKVEVQKNDPNGWGTLGYSVSFEAEDPTIVDVGARYGQITALKVGKTNVIATFTKDGEELTASFPVTVKSYAHSVALDQESEDALAAFVVGDTLSLKAVVTDAEGNEEIIETLGHQPKLAQILAEREYVTDYVKVEVSNPEDQDVLEYDSETYELKAVGVGEATFTLIAYRWDWTPKVKTNYGWFPWRTVTKEYTVTVEEAVPTVKSANLVSVTKVVLDVENVTDENVKELQITNGNGVPQNISFKDAVLSEDKTQVTVEHRSGLVNGDVLNFFYGDQEAVRLDVKIGELRQVILDGPFVVTAYDYNGAAIKIRCLDEYGTELNVPDADITYSVEGSQFTQIADGKICIYDEIGTVITLTATYNSGKLNDKNEWETISIPSNPINITAVKAADVTVSNIQYNLKAESYGTDALTIYMGEGAQIFAEVALSNDTKVYSVEDLNISFESLNPDILLVDAATGILTPVKPGVTGILVKYDDGNTAKQSVVASVTVKDAKKLDKVVADLPTVVISNAVGVETKTITFTGKDQYGNDCETNISKVELLTAPTTKDDNGVYDDPMNWVGTTTGMTLTVNGNEQKAGTYTYRVTVDSNVNTVVSVVVRQSSATDVAKAASYKVVAVNKEKVEINPNEVPGTAIYSFKIVAVDAAGVAFANVTDSISDIVVKVGSKEYKPDAASHTSGVYTISLADVVSGGAITVTGGAISGTLEADTNVANSNGQYTVSEGNVTITAKVRNLVAVPFNTGSVSIKKDVPGVTVKDTLVTCTTGKENVEAGIIAQLKLSDDSKYEIQSIDALNSKLEQPGTSIVFVKTVKVAEKRSDGSVVVHTVTLNASFRVTVQ